MAHAVMAVHLSLIVILSQANHMNTLSFWLFKPLLQNRCYRYTCRQPNLLTALLEYLTVLLEYIDLSI